jgi:hypothetical protein
MLNPEFSLASWSLILIGVIFGLSLAGYGVKNRMEANQSESWPTVKGVIVASSMNIDRPEDEIVRYEAHIAYDYVVNAKAFYGSENHAMAEADANILLGEFPKGMEVDVYYHPDDPGKAVLKPGSKGGWVLIALGLFFTLFSASFLVMAIK